VIKPLSRKWRRVGVCVCLTILFVSPSLFGQQPSVQQIIDRSVLVNEADFKAAVHFQWIETDQTSKGSKKFRVTMIEGTPYYRLIAANGQPLSPAQDAQQAKKEQQVIAHRRAESPAERQKRIDTFVKERRRDNTLVAQLTKAFNFTMVGLRQTGGHNVYVLTAMPRPGYKPPTMETQVLTGMHGELWIDETTFHWVKVTAQVIHPVSMEGFLAEVEPGTQFELDNQPVGDGSVWQAAHFSMKSNARVLHFFPRESSEEETYTDYQPISASAEKQEQSSRR
jgi:hypothetical protein